MEGTLSDTVMLVKLKQENEEEYRKFMKTLKEVTTDLMVMTKEVAKDMED